MDGSQQTHELEERREEPFHAAAGSVLTAEGLLERAHDMLARAHIMLDGWQQAVDWHHDYEKFKAQNDKLCHDGGAKDV